ncbi:MAG: FHA domain-containing protein [Planctomycetota bacterium]|nr:MAG: FHA domain-containing protein [Planctomycetota bacterium]
MATTEEGKVKLIRRDDGSEHALEEGMVFGRSPQCQATVSDSSISRRHAQVELRDGQWWMVDLGSSNGSARNGRKENAFPLQPGDLVTLGAVAFDVQGKAPAATAPLADSDPIEVAPEPPKPVADVAEKERARIRAELRNQKRSAGLGDLDQLSFSMKLGVFAVAVLVLIGVYYGVQFLGNMISPP